LNAKQSLHVIIQRGNTTFEGNVVPQPVSLDETGASGWYPDEPIIVGSLEAGMPAEKAGMQLGDKIVAMDGKPLGSLPGMKDALQQSKDKTVEFTIERGDKTLQIKVQPILAGVPGASQATRDNWLTALLRKIGLGRPADVKKYESYRIGFTGGPPPMKRASLPLREAFARSLATNKSDSALLLQLVGKLVQGKVSPKTISGPIGIAQMTGAAAQAQGWAPLLVLTCLISLQLGVFNLLPIPIMDGGVILLLFIESLMRRDISLRIKERIYQTAFVFLILFAAMVIYNDIAKTIARSMQ
jgi:regulator of sigma E protease